MSRQIHCIDCIPPSLPLSRRSAEARLIHPCARQGLTLLELLVVLVILTIVATVAVSSLAPRVETVRFDKTKSTLDAISDATVGPRQARQVDGSPLLSGFVADIGRLPKRTSLSGQAELPSQADSNFDQNDETQNRMSDQTLQELWDRQTLIASEYPFQFRSGPNTPVDYSDIQIPCGWRGPYLRLPAGPSAVVQDAWGKPFEYLANGADEVEIVRWNGNSSFDVEMLADLTTGKVSVSGTLNFDQPLPSDLKVVLLTPDPETSRSVLSLKTDENSSVAAFQFSQVPVGLRAICIVVDNQRVVTKYVQVPHEGLSLVIDLSGKLP